MSLALRRGLFTTEPPGKPKSIFSYEKYIPSTFFLPSLWRLQRRRAHTAKKLEVFYKILSTLMFISSTINSEIILLTI